MRSYEDLTFYQEMYALTLDLYPALLGFPQEERFELAKQMRKAAVSVLSNIAEGSGRATPGEYANSVSNACGSAAELDCQLKLSRDPGMMPAETANGFLTRLDRVRRQARGFHDWLKRSGELTKRRTRGIKAQSSTLKADVDDQSAGST